MGNRRDFLGKVLSLSAVGGLAGCTESTPNLPNKGEYIGGGEDTTNAILADEWTTWDFTIEQPVRLEYTVSIDDYVPDGVPDGEEVPYDLFLVDTDNYQTFSEGNFGETEFISEGTVQNVTGTTEKIIQLPQGDYHLIFDNSTYGYGKPLGAYGIAFDAEYSKYKLLQEPDSYYSLIKLGNLGSCSDEHSISVKYLEYDEGFGDYQMRYDIRFGDVEEGTTYTMTIDMDDIGELSQSVTAGKDQHFCEIAFISFYEPSGPELDEGDEVDATISVSDGNEVLAETEVSRTVTD